MSALMGTFVTVKTMADGTPRLTLDLDCTLADIAALGMIPGTPFGIARISGESTVAPVAEQKERAGQLCVMACNFCKEPAFWSFIREVHKNHIESEAEAKSWLLEACGIESRRELDTNAVAKSYFMPLRTAYMAWRGAQHGVEFA